MLPEKIEQVFTLNVEAIQLLQNALDTSFLDAYIENAENLIDNYQVRVIDGHPDAKTAQRLTEIYQQMKENQLAPEEWRKLSQLLLLKGSKEEHLQPNHQLTPDTIGYLFVYLIEQLFPNKKQPLTILDVASGMGNLLLTSLLNLQIATYQAAGIGVDIDDTLLSIAASTSELTEADVQFFHQDGLQDLLIEPVDVAMSDLPIGYYPNNQKAADFLTKAEEGHSYAHHLLMEQAMKYVKEAGFGLFLVPSNFLETDQSDYLKKWLVSEVYLQGAVQLPDELFKTKESSKSILILQKKGHTAKQVDEVLVAKIASIKNTDTIMEFFKQFENWKNKNF
ncbi:adenine methyltransferase [Enterococcus sp. JM4C]|uniref:class I SAM-dependent methyltransferase n=1 Tax=Candidatus Enterococcus huntleyi TaxID=1857217 RepID=UPI00137A0885|nr:class I SAM-dependent methyltransferase [Enterococcus sp. JM4C]KAF1299101.1 adenine methyltransferase [Enterococcus sp. JM4C]